MSATTGDHVEITDGANHRVSVEWGTPRDLYASMVEQTDKIGQIRWRGELPGGRGIAWLFASDDSPLLASRAIVRGPYHLFTCVASGAPVLADALAQLAVCRSLIVLGESPAAALADLISGEQAELPEHPAWKTCHSDRDCIVLHSPCGDETAPINRASRVAATKAWTVACGKDAGTAKTSPGRCRHEKCGHLQPSLSEQIEDQQAGSSR